MVKQTPMGAAALAAISASGCFQMKPTALTVASVEIADEHRAIVGQDVEQKLLDTVFVGLEVVPAEVDAERELILSNQRRFSQGVLTVYERVPQHPGDAQIDV